MSCCLVKGPQVHLCSGEGVNEKTRGQEEKMQSSLLRFMRREQEKSLERVRGKGCCRLHF